MAELPAFLLIQCNDQKLAIPAWEVNRIMEVEEALPLKDVGYDVRSFCALLQFNDSETYQALMPTRQQNSIWLVTSVRGIISYPLADLYPVPPIMQLAAKQMGLSGWLITGEEIIPVLHLSRLPRQ